MMSLPERIMDSGMGIVAKLILIQTCPDQSQEAGENASQLIAEYEKDGI